MAAVRCLRAGAWFCACARCGVITRLAARSEKSGIYGGIFSWIFVDEYGVFYLMSIELGYVCVDFQLMSGRFCELLSYAGA